MGYSPTNWIDKNVQFPHRYELTLVSPGIYDFVAVPGTVTNVGTPVNAVNLNNIESGIRDLADIIALGGIF